MNCPRQTNPTRWPCHVPSVGGARFSRSVGDPPTKGFIINGFHYYSTMYAADCYGVPDREELVEMWAEREEEYSDE